MRVSVQRLHGVPVRHETRFVDASWQAMLAYTSSPDDICAAAGSREG